nr:hypothetical protein [Methylibium sp.]
MEAARQLDDAQAHPHSHLPPNRPSYAHALLLGKRDHHGSARAASTLWAPSLASRISDLFAPHLLTPNDSVAVAQILITLASNVQAHFLTHASIDCIPSDRAGSSNPPSALPSARRGSAAPAAAVAAAAAAAAVAAPVVLSLSDGDAGSLIGRG